MAEGGGDITWKRIKRFVCNGGSGGSGGGSERDDEDYLRSRGGNDFPANRTHSLAATATESVALPPNNLQTTRTKQKKTKKHHQMAQNFCTLEDWNNLARRQKHPSSSQQQQQHHHYENVKDLHLERIECFNNHCRSGGGRERRRTKRSLQYGREESFSSRRHRSLPRSSDQVDDDAGQQNCWVGRGGNSMGNLDDAELYDRQCCSAAAVSQRGHLYNYQQPQPQQQPQRRRHQDMIMAPQYLNQSKRQRRRQQSKDDRSPGYAIVV